MNCCPSGCDSTIGQDARDDVGRPGRRERHDERDRPLRIGRLRRPGRTSASNAAAPAAVRPPPPDAADRVMFRSLCLRCYGYDTGRGGRDKAPDCAQPRLPFCGRAVENLGSLLKSFGNSGDRSGNLADGIPDCGKRPVNCGDNNGMTKPRPTQAADGVARFVDRGATARGLSDALSEELRRARGGCRRLRGLPATGRSPSISAIRRTRPPCARWSRSRPAPRPPTRSRSRRIAARDWVKASLDGLTPVDGRALRRAWRARPRARRRQPHRHRDRGGARLRHRPSRHHARLPAGARRLRQGAARPRARARRRHRHRRARDRGGAGAARAACWRATSIRVAVRDGARECAAQPRQRHRPFVRAAGVGARHARARRRSTSCSPTSCSGRCSGWRRRWRALVAPGARVVLSGLLPPQANAALAAYRAQGFALERRIPLDGWATLVLRDAGRCRRCRTTAARPCSRPNSRSFDDRMPTPAASAPRADGAAHRARAARPHRLHRAARRPAPERIRARRPRSGSPGSPASPARPAPPSC